MFSHWQLVCRGIHFLLPWSYCQYVICFQFNRITFELASWITITTNNQSESFVQNLIAIYYRTRAMQCISFVAPMIYGMKIDSFINKKGLVYKIVPCLCLIMRVIFDHEDLNLTRSVRKMQSNVIKQNLSRLAGSDWHRAELPRCSNVRWVFACPLFSNTGQSETPKKFVYCATTL